MSSSEVPGLYGYFLQRFSWFHPICFSVYYHLLKWHMMSDSLYSFIFFRTHHSFRVTFLYPRLSLFFIQLQINIQGTDTKHTSWTQVFWSHTQHSVSETCRSLIFHFESFITPTLIYKSLIHLSIYRFIINKVWMRPDGIVVLPPVGNAVGIFCILEHKRMSDVCDRYLIRAKSTAENQYASLRGAISTVIQRQGWKVEQISFITAARSVEKQDLTKNLKFFRVPEVSINSIYSKLAMRAFDVYANILKCMYSTRLSGGATRSEVSPDAQLTPCVVTSLTHTIDTLPKSDNFKRRKKERPEVKDK